MRIVVVSALNTNDSIERALSLGANDFVAKPILMERLYDAVSRQFEAVLATGDGVGNSI